MARGTYRDECMACGQVFRSPMAEAKHRHNFPVMCKRNKRFARWQQEHGNGTS